MVNSIWLFGIRSRYRITPRIKRGVILNGCSAVSYFSTRRGSIIGAGRLSFRVRDGSGLFPAAVAAVTLFYFQPRPWWCFWWWGVVSKDSWLRGCDAVCGVTHDCSDQLVLNLVCVSFRPVSASSLRLLRGF